MVPNMENTSDLPDQLLDLVGIIPHELLPSAEKEAKAFQPVKMLMPIVGFIPVPF